MHLLVVISVRLTRHELDAPRGEPRHRHSRPKDDRRVVCIDDERSIQARAVWDLVQCPDRRLDKANVREEHASARSRRYGRMTAAVTWSSPVAPGTAPDLRSPRRYLDLGSRIRDPESLLVNAVELRPKGVEVVGGAKAREREWNLQVPDLLRITRFRREGDLALVGSGSGAGHELGAGLLESLERSVHLVRTESGG